MYLAKYVRRHGFDGWHWYVCTSLGSYAVWYNKLHNTVYLMAVTVTPRGPHCCQYSIQVASGRIEPRRPISRILDTHPYTRYISLSSEYRSSIPVTEKYRDEQRYWLPWFLGDFSVVFRTMPFCNWSYKKWRPILWFCNCSKSHCYSKLVSNTWAFPYLIAIIFNHDIGYRLRIGGLPTRTNWEPMHSSWQLFEAVRYIASSTILDDSRSGA